MIELIVPAFIAGLITFLAPCTLPLVPAYLAFISGVKQTDLNEITSHTHLRRTIITNGFFFVVGFTVMFVVFGVLAGLLGGALAEWRSILTRIGGICIIVFGLFMLGVFEMRTLSKIHRLRFPKWLTIGTPSASVVIGGTFALGWTPCIGPILGSILLLASSKTTAFSGGFLLLIFSIGVSVPFILTSLLFARASQFIANITPYIRFVSILGGVFLLILGTFLLTDSFDLTLVYGFKIINLLGLGQLETFLIDYL